MSEKEQILNRREALRQGLRWSGLGGLGLLAIGLTIRGRGCEVSDPCAGCREFSKCGLAKAQSERKLKKEVGNE